MVGVDEEKRLALRGSSARVAGEARATPCGGIDDPNRGKNRYYVTLPFNGLWADPQIVDNDDVIAVVSELVGADGVMCQLATDTPVKGSEYQDLHRDTQLLFPETGAESPPYQLAVNFPLVDVTPENGPME